MPGGCPTRRVAGVEPDRVDGANLCNALEPRDQLDARVMGMCRRWKVVTAKQLPQESRAEFDTPFPRFGGHSSRSDYSWGRVKLG
jgi:hypothetical protein